MGTALSDIRNRVAAARAGTTDRLATLTAAADEAQRLADVAQEEADRCSDLLSKARAREMVESWGKIGTK